MVTLIFFRVKPYFEQPLTRQDRPSKKPFLTESRLGSGFALTSYRERNLTDGWKAELALGVKDDLPAIGRAKLSETGKGGGKKQAKEDQKTIGQK
ncbi:hypothetical protein KKI24_18350 [bacterium]|nr:hypothetical protein [bacterium]